MPTRSATKSETVRAPAVSRAYEIASQLESEIISGKRIPRERYTALSDLLKQNPQLL